MATSSLAINRRYRRRRQIAVLLTLAVVVAVIGLAVSYRTERRETTEYLALIGDAARDEMAAAESLRDLFASLAELDRPAILGRIEGLAEQTGEIDAMLDDAVITRPVAGIHGYFSVATESWHQAIMDLDEAVIEVMDEPEGADVGVPAVGLVDVFAALRVGDHAYRSFLDALPELDPELEPPEFPEIAYLGEEGDTDLSALVSRLRLSRGLDERHDVQVTANTEPAPTGDANGVLVMPYEEQLDVTAVVTNSGNVVQEEIEVTLELIPDGEVGEPVTEGRIIAALEPEASESLDFAGYSLEPGALYTLRVTADITDDASTENNVWEILFATNAE